LVKLLLFLVVVYGFRVVGGYEFFVVFWLFGSGCLGIVFICGGRSDICS